MSPDLTAALVAEEARIEAAYARREDRGRYSWFDPAYVLVMQDVERRLLDRLRKAGLDRLAGRRVLEIGCGTGGWLRRLIAWGVQPEDAAGVELLGSRVEAARRLSPPALTIVQGNAARLPYPDASFDLVLQMLVFSSVLDPVTTRCMAGEMLRLVKPGGAIVWYDYHVPSYGNRDVRPMRRREIAELFPGCRIALERTTLAPPLGRLVARRSRWLYRALDAVPLLRTHYLGLIQRH